MIEIAFMPANDHAESRSRQLAEPNIPKGLGLEADRPKSKRNSAGLKRSNFAILQRSTIDTKLSISRLGFLIALCFGP